MSESQRIDAFTEKSVERMHELNKLRDYLHQNTQVLIDMGVVEVIAFGSVVRGEADKDSDIDINFLLSSTSQADEDIDYNQRASAVKSFIKKFLQEEGFKNKEDFHTFVSYLEREGDYPSHAKDKISLWSSRSWEK